MVSPRKTEQQKTTPVNQLDEATDDFMGGNRNRDTQNENKINTECGKIDSGDTSHLVPVNGSQDKMQTVERFKTDRVRCELVNVVAGAETRLHYAILIAMDSLVILEWKSRQSNSSTRKDADSVDVDPDQNDLSGSTEGLIWWLQVRNPNVDLNELAETFIIGPLTQLICQLFNERNFHWLVFSHHIVTRQNTLKKSWILLLSYF